MKNPVKYGMKQAALFRKIMEQDGGSQLIGIGYKIYDSLQRRAILKGSEENGIEKKRRAKARFFRLQRKCKQKISNYPLTNFYILYIL